MVRPALRAIRQTELWEQPMVRRAFPVPVADRLLTLWQDHPALLDALDRLPHMLCHLDAWRPNLLSVTLPSGDSETVALDWAFVGTGAIGEEVGQLVAGSLLPPRTDVSNAVEFGEKVLESYLDGLGDAGWRGDPRMVRLGYCASAAVRWGLRAPGLHASPTDPAAGSTEDAAVTLERRAALTYYLLDLADEARALIAALG